MQPVGGTSTPWSPFKSEHQWMGDLDFYVRLSGDGFLNAGQKLRPLLVQDNNFVLSRGLTHQDIAKPILQIMKTIEAAPENLSRRDNPFSFGGSKDPIQDFYAEINHKRFRVRPLQPGGYYAGTGGSYRSGAVGFGLQGSPFGDNLFANYELEFENVSTGEKLHMDALTPHFIYKYGFYQGSIYRISPEILIRFFWLLNQAARREPDFTIVDRVKSSCKTKLMLKNILASLLFYALFISPESSCFADASDYYTYDGGEPKLVQGQDPSDEKVDEWQIWLYKRDDKIGGINRWGELHGKTVDEVNTALQVQQSFEAFSNKFFGLPKDHDLLTYSNPLGPIAIHKKTVSDTAKFWQAVEKLGTARRALKKAEFLTSGERDNPLAKVGSVLSDYADALAHAQTALSRAMPYLDDLDHNLTDSLNTSLAEFNQAMVDADKISNRIRTEMPELVTAKEPPHSYTAPLADGGGLISLWEVDKGKLKLGKNSKNPDNSVSEGVRIEFDPQDIDLDGFEYADFNGSYTVTVYLKGSAADKDQYQGIGHTFDLDFASASDAKNFIEYIKQVASQ